jgi:hypothetical protein
MHRIDDAKDALRFLLDFAPAAPREVTSQAVLATMEDGSLIYTTLIQVAIAMNTSTEAPFSRMPRSVHSGSATTR